MKIRHTLSVIFFLTAVFSINYSVAKATTCQFENKKQFIEFLITAPTFNTSWLAKGKEVKAQYRFSGSVKKPKVEIRLTSPGGSKYSRWWPQRKEKLSSKNVIRYLGGDGVNYKITVYQNCNFFLSFG